MTTLKELIAMCKERGIRGYSGKKKAEVEALLGASSIQTGLKPLFKWPGGKTDELSLILPFIPASFQTYVEPFVGGGALFFYLCPPRAVISDLNQDLISFYKAMQGGQGQSLYAFMDEHAKLDADALEASYYNVRDKMEATEESLPFRFFFFRKLAYRGMIRYNQSGKWNVPFGHYKKVSYEELIDPRYEELLKRTSIQLASYEKVMLENDEPTAFIFLDPPYDCVFTDYGHDAFTRDDQQRLHQLFISSKAMCLMVIAETPFIKDLYRDYIISSYEKSYRIIADACKDSDEPKTIHLVIANSPLKASLKEAVSS
jgi:DNA adenine methylase